MRIIIIHGRALFRRGADSRRLLRVSRDARSPARNASASEVCRHQAYPSPGGQRREISYRSALHEFENLVAGSVDVSGKVRLHAALATALSYVRSSVWKSAKLCLEVLVLAAQCGDADFHNRVFRSLWNATLLSGKTSEQDLAPRRLSFAINRGRQRCCLPRHHIRPTVSRFNVRRTIGASAAPRRSP
jgi:hypothetical protein